MSKTILIIDDENSILHALADKLANEGLEVLSAKNGKQGLEKALSEQPDLILLDLKMPVMGGEEMLKKLRADDWGKKVPVIILSNMADSSTIYETIKLGDGMSLNDYLVKSDTSLETILNIIKEKLS